MSADQLGEDGAFDVATSFLVVHEISPALKPAAFAAVARALKPGGFFLIFDEVYPVADYALQKMPTRFAALAQWYELTWGNVVDTRAGLEELCSHAGLSVTEENQLLALQHPRRGEVGNHQLGGDARKPHLAPVGPLRRLGRTPHTRAQHSGKGDSVSRVSAVLEASPEPDAPIGQ